MSRPKYGEELKNNVCKCGNEKDHRASTCMKCRKHPFHKGKGIVWCTYRKYRTNAGYRKLRFELTLEEFKEIVTKPCSYCGDSSRVINGIDRIDSSIGYVFSNSAPCCSICNYAKSNLKQYDFYAWVERVFMYSLQKGKHAAEVRLPLNSLVSHDKDKINA